MNVFIIAAISADGFIGQRTDQLADWTSKEDKKVFVELTKRAGVMVMGSTTFKTIGRALPGRRTIVYSRSLQPSEGEGIEVTHEEPADLIKRLDEEGFDEVAICGGKSIYDLFLQAGVVDELFLTIEPVLFGTGIPLLETATETPLRLQETQQLNDDTILLRYEVKR
jgi:dihydrofolate reductase